MKSRTTTSVSAWIILSVMLLLGACKKEASVQSPVVSEEESIELSQENTTAEAEYDDLTEIGFSAAADLEVNASVETNASINGLSLDTRPDLFPDLLFKVGPCTKIEISRTDSTWPKTIVINYGDGCICRDGKFRKGAIVLHFTGPIRRPGSILTITLRGFYVNRMHIEGTKTIKNLSENGVHKFSVHIEDGAVTLPSGRGFKYEGTKVVTQVRGMETRTVRDDVYSIEGRNKTSYANGTVVVKNTETPLIKPVACPWIVQGVLKIKINDRVLFIDFGNGDCDNKATLKWANGEIEIRLP